MEHDDAEQPPKYRRLKNDGNREIAKLAFHPHDGESMLDDDGDNMVYIVRGFLNTDEIDALQSECNILRKRYEDNDPLEYAAALDPFEYVNIAPSSDGRTCRDAYIRERCHVIYGGDVNHQHDDVIIQSDISRGSSGELHSHMTRINELLFTKLPNLILQAVVDGMPTEKKMPLDRPLYLFNEHYVVKEPKSDLAFRWHRDSDEQMPFIPFNQRPRYFSCWCSLDDVNAHNGSLVMEKTGSVIEYKVNKDGSLLSQASGHIQAISYDTGCAVTTGNEGDCVITNGWSLEAEKGTVVIFSGNKWHCSGVNDTEAARRVFYAQYSLTPITVGSRDPEPLAFAVPIE